MQAYSLLKSILCSFKNSIMTSGCIAQLTFSPSSNCRAAASRIPGKTSQDIHKILNKGELIGLSDAQRKQITALLVEAETGTARASAQSSALIAEFYGKLSSGGVSDDEIKAYTKRMGELRAAHLQANLMSSVHAAALLSDAQKAKLYGNKKSQAGKK